MSDQEDNTYSGASYDVDNDDEVETSTTRLQSITPEEWADIKKLTKQESIRPSEIEEPETPLEQTQSRFNFDEEYSRHFGKPFGMPEADEDQTENERQTSLVDRDISPDIDNYTQNVNDFRKLSSEESEASVAYEENEYRIEDTEDVSDTDSNSSIDSARYNGTAYSQKFARQYSNHEELFTPPPNAVPEFPNFPGEEELADFAAAAIDEPEIEDEIERRQNAVINMALRKEDGMLIDWVNQFTNREVENFGEDFEDPNIWISLMHGLICQLGHYDMPNIKTGDYDAAYEYCNWAMNELGIDERNELNLLMTADDLFGGHAMLNQTVVSLINAAFKTKLLNYQAQQNNGSSSEDESISEEAIYDSPDSTDVTEENIDYEDNRGPRPDTPESLQNAEYDSKVQVEEKSRIPSKSIAVFTGLAVSFFFALSK